MDAEIAELEGFIDSYITEDYSDPISSEVFTNAGIKTEDYGCGDISSSPNRYDHKYGDFQEELREHQKKQENLKSNESEGSFERWIVNELASPQQILNHGGYHNVSPINGWGPNHPGFPGDLSYFPRQYQGEGLPPATFPPPHSGYTDAPRCPPAMFTGLSAPPTSQTVRRESKLPGNIPKNDLRHHLNNNKTPSGQAFQNGFHDKKEEQQRRQWPKGSYSRDDQNLNALEKGKGNAESNWRISDRTPPQRRDSGRSETSSSSGKGERKNSNKTPPEQDPGKKSNSRHSSQSSSCESVTTPCSKVLPGRSKAEVQSWLKQESKNPTTPIERQMKQLEVTKTNDIPRLKKIAQAFVTSGKKLHEVAEMICTKGIRNPQFAENCAILCCEMSQRLVNGTSFRTVVLNIVQGHFKNRLHIMANTIRNPAEDTWSGFVAFLIELYLRLHTSSNERLKALINPVYDCFFQMLDEKSANFVITKCFALNIKKVGPVLEAADAQQMSKLISLLRDSCILPSDLSTEARRYLLQSLETYARGWKNHALDNSYYGNCSSKALAS